MSKNVEISKIIIKIGEQEIPLTIAEAMELRIVLENTLKDKTWRIDPIPVPVIPPIPVPVIPPIPVPVIPPIPVPVITWEYSASDNTE